MLTDCVSVTIDGFPDYLHKLALTERPTIPSPKRQYDETQVKGRLGSLVQEYAYDDVTFTLEFNYLEEVLEYQAFKEKFYIIRNWLYQGKELQFSDEPNIKYIIQTLEIDEADNDIQEYGKFSVKITVKPFGRVVEDTPITVDNPTTFQLLNNAFVESYPLVMITPSDTTARFILNNHVFAFEDLTVGETVQIDSDLMMCYVEQSDGDILDYSNRMLTMEYPVLNSEVNTFTCENISKIEIYRNALR